jgi:disulfide oxidoreductase YuzD
MVLIEVSNGEIVDKYTILLLKRQYFNNTSNTLSLDIINTEINVLETAMGSDTVAFSKGFIGALYNTNQYLWELEDAVRLKIKNTEFDAEYIDITQDIVLTNQKRYHIKQQINELSNSTIHELKSY